MRRFLLVAASMCLLAFGTTGVVQARDAHHAPRVHDYPAHRHHAYAHPNPGGHGHRGHYHSGHRGYGPSYARHRSQYHGSWGHGVQINTPYFGLRIGH